MKIDLFKFLIYLAGILFLLPIAFQIKILSEYHSFDTLQELVSSSLFSSQCILQGLLTLSKIVCFPFDHVFSVLNKFIKVKYIMLTLVRPVTV